MWRWFLIAATLGGCSSADFDVAAPGEDVAGSDVESTDTSAPPSDTSTPDVPPPADTGMVAEACVKNVCGGCEMLERSPGGLCGICSTSKFVCATMNAVKCDMPDDRTDGKDTYFNGYDGNGLTLSGSGTVAISFGLARAGSPTSITLAMQRYDVATGVSIGNLRVRLIKGSPTLTVDAMNVLATSLVPATSVPDTPMNLTVVLPPIAQQAKGSPLWIEIADQSDLSNFAVNGAAGGPSELKFYFSSMTGYVEKTGMDPYLVVGMKACF